MSINLSVHYKCKITGRISIKFRVENIKQNFSAKVNCVYHLINIFIHVFIYGSFKDAVSSLDYIKRRIAGLRSLMNNKLEIMWKEVVVA
jgi:hypothetical protein